MATLTARELNRATLARQGLLERQRATVPEMVERLAGLQAQEPKPAFVALWTRLEDFDARVLRDDLQAGTLVRGTLMRATLHLASASAFAAFRPVLQPVLDRSLRSVVKSRNAGELDLEAIENAARDLLAPGPLTFEDIRQGLAERFPETEIRTLGYAARMRLPLSIAPGPGPWGYDRPPRFALQPTGGGDPARLARAYLAAFGPATPADFAVWSGLPGSVLTGLREELESLPGGLLDLPGAPRPDPDTPAPVRLLGEFDNLLLSYADRRRIIDDEHRPRVVAKGNLRVKGTFLVDGRVAGTWSAKGARIELEPFGRLTKGVRSELEEEAGRLAGFVKAQAR